MAKMNDVFLSSYAFIRGFVLLGLGGMDSIVLLGRLEDLFNIISLKIMILIFPAVSSVDHLLRMISGVHRPIFSNELLVWFSKLNCNGNVILYSDSKVNLYFHAVI